MSDIEVDKVENYDGDSKPKRKRELSGSRSRSPTRSPRRSPSPPRTRRRKSSSPPLSNHRRDPDGPNVRDVNPERRKERERQLALRMAEIELGTAPPKPEFDAKAEFAKLLNSRSGGVYVPPARLRALQAAAAEDKSSAEYQRLSWDALRKSITGIVNRVNVGNIKHVIPELFQENLVRGRGLFARSIMKAQAASLPFTPIFAALVAVINTKLPQVGELLLTRLISQFRRSFKRNDKVSRTPRFCASAGVYLVAHEIIALQILVLLLEQPTDDSVEIAVGFMREVGAYLAENSPRANNGVYERFLRKDKYKDNVIVPEGLDLVEEDDQITHQISLDDELQIQEGLNVFKFDPNYVENEEKYKEIRAEILGEDSDDESGSSGSESDSEEDGEEAVADKPGITDMTETNLVNLRRTIYLTIMNALSYEEAVHKLMKVNIQEGQEIELCNMIVECCSQERSYSNFYGLIGNAFANYYETIHRYETNRLRNIARFFGHLIATDGISWAVFSVVKINEDDTTSSSRIFVKILMQELQESMGLKTMSERFKDPTMRESFTNMFPMDDPTGKSTRFAVNYFTALGLGVLTEDMRANLLENARKIAAIRDLEAQRAAMEESSSSDSSDSTTSSDTDSSDSDSDSDSDDSRYARRRRSQSRSRSPPPHPSRRTVGLLGGEAILLVEDQHLPGGDVGLPLRSRDRGRLLHHLHLVVARLLSSRRPDDTPPRKGGRDDSPPPRGGRDSPPPPPRDRRINDSRRDSPPPRDRRRDDSPRDRRRDDSPPRDRRRDSPRRDRRRDSPPPRDRRRDSPSRDRRRDDSPPQDRRRGSPPPRDSRKDDSPRDRRRDSPPPPRRHRDSPPRRNQERSLRPLAGAFSLLRNLDLPGWVATSPLHDWLGAPDQNPYPEL
ncbi:pre-mRNA-splicing factor CWC22 [Rhizoctonia solani]|uniref:Pre-mRNA-splicing factor CWC22 n=1 Tax=Rhizoctonia solani TaxID=456999 RepID=A0A8H8P7B2_9AGAM|nr:pre-mRNA-splicing factor CWC22 [Rhizoctonia solani]QRW26911.1 pre-mRNA-splicing factor CWC22 [Rhizoctonia solani]